jgi:peptide/nickel transport system substrate-binding protein
VARVGISLVVLVLALSGLFGAGAPVALGQEATAGGDITVGLDFEPDSLDPHVTPYAVSHTVMMNVFDTLVWRDQAGEFQPGLAERWEVSDDGTEFTFHLRDGVTFHDGTPFDAESVKFNFDRIADPETQSGFASTLLGPYEGTEVLDPRTAKVTFSAPAPGFLDGASQAFLGMVSPAAVEQFGADFGRNPVGTGFMRFVEWAPQDHITLERNPDYAWAPPIFAHEGPAYLDRIEFRFYPEGATRLAALQAGDADVVDNVLSSDLLILEGDSNFQVMRAEALGLPIVILLNTAAAPTDDVAVRQALNYALDRQQMVDVAMFGGTQPAYGPLAPRTPYYLPDVESMYPYDLARAGEVLDAAGWTMGDDGVRSKDGQPLVIRWAVTPWDAPWAELAQAQLSQIGAAIEISQMADAPALEAMANDETNMLSTAWASSDPVVLSTVFHSRNIEGGSAMTKYANPELDALLETGESTVDETARGEAYAGAQELIVGEALIVPVSLWPQHVAMSSAVTGVGRDFRNYLWLYDATVSA